MKIDNIGDDSDDSVIGKTRLRHLRARPAIADSLSHRRVWPRQVNCDAIMMIMMMIMMIMIMIMIMIIGEWVWPRQVNCDASFHLFIIILNIFLPRLVIFTVNQDIGLSAGNQLCGNLTGQHGRVIIVWSSLTLEQVIIESMQLLSQTDESALFTDMITRALLLYEQRRHSARASDDSKVSVYLDVDPINIKDPIRLFVFAGR